MGFRCSILGCEYTERHHERERERRGDEVVLTVREYEECRHCGDRRLISENTGVTTAPDVDPAEATSDDDLAEATSDDDLVEATSDDDPEPTVSADSEESTRPAEDAVILDADPADDPDDPADDLPDEDEGVEFLDPDPADGPEPATTADPDDLDDSAEDLPNEDEDEDAVILAADAAEDGAQADARTATDAGEGKAEAEGESEDGVDSGAWPEHDPTDDTTYDGGDWPAHPDPADTEESFAGVVSAPAGGPATATATPASAESDSEMRQDATVEHGPEARTTRTDVAGELYCQSCGFSDAPSGTPHRPGDICPACGSGYLAER